jgi:hypothetical protein
MTGGFARLTGPVTLAGRAAQSRVMFGPHETNLGQASVGGRRAFSPRHVAGALRTAARAPGRERLALLPDWLEAECRRPGARIDTGTAACTWSAAAPGACRRR